MSELDRAYKNMTDNLDKLVRTTLSMMMNLGHKTFGCATCKKEADIKELYKNAGICDGCFIKTRRESCQ